MVKDIVLAKTVQSKYKTKSTCWKRLCNSLICSASPLSSWGKSKNWSKGKNVPWPKKTKSNWVFSFRKCHSTLGWPFSHNSPTANNYAKICTNNKKLIYQPKSESSKGKLILNTLPWTSTSTLSIKTSTHDTSSTRASESSGKDDFHHMECLIQLLSPHRHIPLSEISFRPISIPLKKFSPSRPIRILLRLSFPLTWSKLKTSGKSDIMWSFP